MLELNKQIWLGLELNHGTKWKILGLRGYWFRKVSCPSLFVWGRDGLNVVTTCHYPNCLYSTRSGTWICLESWGEMTTSWGKTCQMERLVAASLTASSIWKLNKNGDVLGSGDINLRIKLGPKKNPAILWCNMDQHGDNLMGFPNRLWLVMLISRIWDSHLPTPSQFPEFFHHQTIPSMGSATIYFVQSWISNLMVNQITISVRPTKPACWWHRHVVRHFCWWKMLLKHAESSEFLGWFPVVLVREQSLFLAKYGRILNMLLVSLPMFAGSSWNLGCFWWFGEGKNATFFLVLRPVPSSIPVPPQRHHWSHPPWKPRENGMISEKQVK